MCTCCVNTNRVLQANESGTRMSFVAHSCLRPLDAFALKLVLKEGCCGGFSWEKALRALTRRTKDGLAGLARNDTAYCAESNLFCLSSVVGVIKEILCFNT